tara:strand:- start:591 stop:884 length:294 start_codon:yes stop_codon:yes gene_type:complete
MAEVTRGSGIRTDVSSRSEPTYKSSGKYNKLVQLGAGDHSLSGSLDGVGGFIIIAPGTTELYPVEGAPISASYLEVGTFYPIGLSRVTGSGTVSLVY